MTLKWLEWDRNDRMAMEWHEKDEIALEWHQMILEWHRNDDIVTDDIEMTWMRDEW